MNKMFVTMRKLHFVLLFSIFFVVCLGFEINIEKKDVINDESYLNDTIFDWEDPLFGDDESLNFWRPHGARHSNGKGVLQTTMVENVDEPFIIPLGTVQNAEGNIWLARRWIHKNLRKNSAHTILYPMNFTQIVDDRSNATFNATVFPQKLQHYPEGAIISTDPNKNRPDRIELGETGYDDEFSWLTTVQNISLSEARAVYDVSIAVLQVRRPLPGTEGPELDLTFEADSYCDSLYSWLSGKYIKCFQGADDFEDYALSHPSSVPESVVVMVTPEDLQRRFLHDEDNANGLRFGILVLPDIITGTTEAIVGYLGPGGVSEISLFVEHGGTLFASGKSGYLVEQIALIDSGSFDPVYELVNHTQATMYVEGCSEDYFGNSNSHELQFVRRTLCFSHPKQNSRDIHSSSIITHLSSYFPNPSILEQLIPIASYTNHTRLNYLRKRNIQSGLDSSVDEYSGEIPAILFGNRGKGQIVLNLGAPVYSSRTAQWFYSAILLAGSRPLMLDNRVVGVNNRLIPALETLDLSVELVLRNLFSAAFEEKVNLTINVRQGLELRVDEYLMSFITSENCGIEDVSYMKTDECIKMTDITLAAFETLVWKIGLHISDVMISQTRTEITLLYPQIEYLDMNGIKQVIEYGIKVDSAMAALLRADMNIDPSSTYPLKGKGSYIDNVMNCENKEETVASDVMHISIVPLISPLIDIMDQVNLPIALEFYEDYYKQSRNGISDYHYPMVDQDDFDYIDFTRLHEFKATLAVSWDEAVKLYRVARDTIPGAGPANGTFNIASEIPNSQATTHNENDFLLLKQEAFDDSDMYFEHGTQRLMAFSNTWDPDAAAAFYEGAVPVDIQAASSSSRAKKKVLFVRNDIFFWEKYPLPEGLVASNNTFSLDRFLGRNCQGTGFQPAEELATGVFDWTQSPSFVPGQWDNELLLNCERDVVNPSDPSSYSEEIELIHYVIPIEDPEVSDPEDLEGFLPSGEYENYPEIKFISIHRGLMDISPEYSRKGGKLVIDLPINMTFLSWNPIEDGFVTVSADQVAIHSIEYNREYDSLINRLTVFFKRGNMPNEAYGQPSHLQMNLEQLNTLDESFNITLAIHDLVYDISDVENGFEHFLELPSSTQTVIFSKTHAFSLPALKMKFKPDNEKEIIQPYEFMEPFVRYGIYQQELLHRPVHGSAEFHPIAEPCVVTNSAGFSSLTHIGTSSIPFREYVRVGTSQLIPSSPETGRIEWTDSWGRHWMQPVRSTIFEYPPIPPPLRNFQMTTTFELLDPSSGERMTEWHSEHEAAVHVQLKFVNNYPKWFEITNCKENEVMQLRNEGNFRSRVFDVDSDFAELTDYTDSNQWVFVGHNASYGQCFYSPPVFLEGQELSAEQRDLIQLARSCSSNEADISDCENLADLPNVHRRNMNLDNQPEIWNFAAQVDDYWPDNYVKSNMWDMTHYDYDDTKFDKAYKYHMDNRLPSFDSVRNQKKPENLVAFPLFKGLGYRMTYDKNYGVSLFPGKKGWWSGNLQNRDHTLVAGQGASNDIAVGKDSLIDADRWMEAVDCTNSEMQADSALTNIYACLFNRMKVQVDPEGNKAIFLGNIYQNNVIPIPPDVSDEDLYAFDCDTSIPTLSPDELSSVDNILYTDSARDWLYFAINLRGNAKEDLSVMYQLTPFSSDIYKFEGVAKIHDGSRFVYWNPANSINSYLVVDNPVSTVMAYRNDISLGVELIPSSTLTFGALVFQHISLSDPPEIFREWDLPIWIQHHGFGDFTISIYVGGNGKGVNISPGGRSTRVKYTFTNHAGFDIDLLVKAIEGPEISMVINSDDLMSRHKHTIRSPTKYNFLIIDIPPELRDHIEIAPSPDVVGVAPLFFDFDSINVAKIIDGWKGDYYYDIKLLDTFPDELRGRLYELPVYLNVSCFDMLPGPYDETGIHDYELTVPSILFGVPYANNHPKYPGKVFTTHGYATNLNVTHGISNLIPESALLVEPEDLDLARMCIGGSYEIACLEEFWENLTAIRQKIPLSYVMDGVIAQTNYDLNDIAPQFPIKILPELGPDIAEIHILTKTFAEQFPHGYTDASLYAESEYFDWKGYEKSFIDDTSLQVHAKGAWLQAWYSGELVTDDNLHEVLLDQRVWRGRNVSLRVTITAQNVGDQYAYHTNMSIILPKNIEPLVDLLDDSLSYNLVPLFPLANGRHELVLYFNSILAPGSRQSVEIILRSICQDDCQDDENDHGDDGGGNDDQNDDVKVRDYLDFSIQQEESNSLRFTECASATIDLTEYAGERTVTQWIDEPFDIQYNNDPMPNNTVFLSGEDSGSNTITLTASHVVENVTWYVWKRKLHMSSIWEIFEYSSNNQLTTLVYDFSGGFGVQNGSILDGVDYLVSITTVNFEGFGSPPAILESSNIWEYEKPGGRKWGLFGLFILPLGAVAFLVFRRQQPEMKSSSKIKDHIKKYIAKDDTPSPSSRPTRPVPRPPMAAHAVGSDIHDRMRAYSQSSISRPAPSTQPQINSGEDSLFKRSWKWINQNTFGKFQRESQNMSSIYMAQGPIRHSGRVLSADEAKSRQKEGDTMIMAGVIPLEIIGHHNV